jgi:hypothetical protein
MQFSKTTVPPFTQLELFSNGLKPFWSILETRVRNRSPPPTSLKQLEDVLQEEWYKIPLETVQNLYKSVPRRIAAALMAKGSPTPY